jgi:hypothetical protein
MNHSIQLRVRTLADGHAKCLNLVVHIGTASLSCAVAKTIAEAWVCAETGDISWARATEGSEQAAHVVDAELTTLRDAITCTIS